MTHRLLTLASAASVLLGLGAAGLWARGGRTADLWDAGYFLAHPHPRHPRYTNGKLLRVAHRDGRLTVAWLEAFCIGRPGGPVRAGPGPAGARWVHRQPDDAGFDQAMEVVWADTEQPTTGAGRVRYESRPTVTVLEVPVAALAAAAVPLPLAVLAGRSARRRHRRRLGRCIRCGYDLRATPEQGGPLLARCPECGAVPEGRTGP